MYTDARQPSRHVRWTSNWSNELFLQLNSFYYARMCLYSRLSSSFPFFILSFLLLLKSSSSSSWSSSSPSCSSSSSSSKSPPPPLARCVYISNNLCLLNFSSWLCCCPALAFSCSCGGFLRRSRRQRNTDGDCSSSSSNSRSPQKKTSSKNFLRHELMLHLDGMQRMQCMRYIPIGRWWWWW